MALRNDLALPSLTPPPAPAIDRLPAPPARLLPVNRHRPIVHLPPCDSTDHARTSLAEHHLVGFEEQIAMLASEKKYGDFRDASLVRIHAQSHAEIESSRARYPYTARGEIFPTTALRAAALQLKPSRFLAAYGAGYLIYQTPWQQRSPGSGPHQLQVPRSASVPSPTAGNGGLARRRYAATPSGPTAGVFINSSIRSAMRCAGSRSCSTVQSAA